MKKKTRALKDKIAYCHICRKMKSKASLILVQHEVYACKRHHGVLRAGISFLSELIVDAKHDDKTGGKERLYLLMQMNHSVNSLPLKIRNVEGADEVIFEAKNYLLTYSSFYSIK